MKKKRMAESAGITKYSPPIPGEAGNYNWPVMLDYNEDGYLGITQRGGGGMTMARVLLSPSQVVALRAFIRRRPKATR